MDFPASEDVANYIQLMVQYMYEADCEPKLSLSTAQYVDWPHVYNAKGFALQPRLSSWMPHRGW